MSIKHWLRRRTFFYVLMAVKYYFYNDVVAKFPNHAVRKWYLRHIMNVTIGANTYIGMRVFVTGYPIRTAIVIGDNCVINRDVYLDGRTGVTIGNNVNVSFGVCILSLSHDHNDPSFSAVGSVVTVSDDAWIGARATLLPGVDIGRGSVVAAGAVVSHSVDEYDVVGGVPAHKIGSRNRDIRYVTNFSPYFDTDIFDESPL